MVPSREAADAGAAIAVVGNRLSRVQAGIAGEADLVAARDGGVHGGGAERGGRGGHERRQGVPRAATQVGTEGDGDGGRGQGVGLAGGELDPVVGGLDDIVAGPLGQAIDAGAAGVIVDQLFAARVRPSWVKMAPLSSFWSSAARPAGV